MKSETNLNSPQHLQILPSSQHHVGQTTHSSLRQVGQTSHSSQHQVGQTTHSSQRQVGQTMHSSQHQVGQTTHSSQRQVSQTSHSSQRQISQTTHSSQRQVGQATHSSQRQVGQTTHSSQHQGNHTSHSSQHQIGQTTHSSQRQVGQTSHSSYQIVQSSARYMNDIHFWEWFWLFREQYEQWLCNKGMPALAEGIEAVNNAILMCPYARMYGENAASILAQQSYFRQMELTDHSTDSAQPRRHSNGLPSAALGRNPEESSDVCHIPLDLTLEDNVFKKENVSSDGMDVGAMDLTVNCNSK